MPRQRRPRLAPGGHGPRDRDPPRQRGAHQRRPLLRRPRPPRVSTPSAPTPGRSWCTTGPPSSSCAGRWTPRARCCPTARRSSSTRTTPTARATPTAATRTTSWTGPPLRSHRHHATAHFVTRQIFTGAARWAARRPASGDEVPFQLTQRADFFEEEVGLETTLKRPIVNTRDEPHADAQKYRRLHVIIGDANMSEVATFLKVGTTAIVLAMIEDDASPADSCSPRRSPALRQVSYDLGLRGPSRCRRHHASPPSRSSGSSSSRAQRVRRRPRARGVGETVGTTSSPLGGRPHRLETDPMSLADQLDWVAKYRLIDGYRERHGLEWGDARLRPSTSSTTTCAPSVARPRVGLSARRRRRGRAAISNRPTTPGPTSGASACSGGPRHRGRQLGLARVRRRRRTPAAGPDDGTLPRNRAPTSVALFESCDTPPSCSDRPRAGPPSA
jgi:hypothetical protein